jgi:hypothetical protein
MMDNVQKVCHINNTSSSQSFRISLYFIQHRAWQHNLANFHLLPTWQDQSSWTLNHSNFLFHYDAEYLQCRSFPLVIPHASGISARIPQLVCVLHLKAGAGNVWIGNIFVNNF